jgi:hypothetical protein
MQERLRLSFCPVTLQQVNLWLCGEYADGCLFEKGAEWSLFVWVGAVGAPEGGFRRGGVRGVQPKIRTPVYSKFFYPPGVVMSFCFWLKPFQMLECLLKEAASYLGALRLY